MKNLVLFKLIKQLFLWEIEVNQKLLHLSTFPTTKTQFLTQAQKDSGFTILELITAVLIIGILSAIAVPAWDGFLNRQRISTVNNDVLRVLQKAQLEAKRRQQDVTIKFLSAEDPPEVEIRDIQQNLNPSGDIKQGMILLNVQQCQDQDDDGNCTAYKAYSNNSITFDYTGAVAVQKDTPLTIPFAVTVSRPNGPDGQKRCVFVQTLLGGIRTDEGEFTDGRGCP